MVFGWAKKKTTNGTIESKMSERQVALSEVNDIIKENQARHFKEVAEKVKSIRDAIEIERKNIMQTVSQLESDSLKVDDVDKHLKLMIERSKETVIVGLRKEVAIDTSKTEKYSDIVNLNTDIGQMLKRIGDILGVNTKVMHIFAKKYSEKLKEHIAEIATMKAELQKLVDDHAKFKSDLTAISESCEKIRESQIQIDRKNIELSKTKEEIKNLEKTIRDSEVQIQNLKAKNEYQEFLKIRKEIDSLSPEEDKIKNEIDLQFSKISRPLGKYSYISSLDKPLKKIMEELVTNPTVVVTNENKNSISEILQAVIKGVVAGSVSVKDTDKAIQQIEETINRLDEFIKMKSDLLEKRRSFENKLGIFNQKDLEEKERELGRSREKKTHAEFVVKNLEKEISNALTLIPQLAQDIEIGLKAFSGIKVTLRI